MEPALACVGLLQCGRGNVIGVGVHIYICLWTKFF